MLSQKSKLTICKCFNNSREWIGFVIDGGLGKLLGPDSLNPFKPLRRRKITIQKLEIVYDNVAAISAI